jgi:hypothetical protein
MVSAARAPPDPGKISVTETKYFGDRILNRYVRNIRYIHYGAAVVNCDKNNDAIDIAKWVSRVITCVSQIKSPKPGIVFARILPTAPPLQPAGFISGDGRRREV